MDIQIPTLDGLDPEQPDYVARLDERLVQGRQDGHQYDEHVIASVQGVFQNHVERLRGIPGVTVQPITRSDLPHPVYWDTELSVCLDFSLRSGRHITDYIHLGEKLGTFRIVYTPSNKQEERAIEDELQILLEEGNQNSSVLMRQATALDRGIEDITDALLALTKIEGFCHGEPSSREAMLYAVSKGKVYGIPIDLESRTQKVGQPELQPELSAGMLVEEDIKFRAAVQGEGANVYRAINPSAALDTETLLRYSVDNVISDMNARYKEFAERAAPVTLLVRSMQKLKRFFERFRGQ